MVVISYPLKPTEFEIQAELYLKMRGLGIDVKGELKISKKQTGTRGSIFDLVIFKERKAVAIVEVKKRYRGLGAGGTIQEAKYKEFGIPLIYCFRDNIEDTVKEIQKLL